MCGYPGGSGGIGSQVVWTKGHSFLCQRHPCFRTLHHPPLASTAVGPDLNDHPLTCAHLLQFKFVSFILKGGDGSLGIFNERPVYPPFNSIKVLFGYIILPICFMVTDGDRLNWRRVCHCRDPHQAYCVVHTNEWMATSCSQEGAPDEPY